MPNGEKSGVMTTSDAGKDIDDSFALLIQGYLMWIDLLYIIAIIANLKSAEKRALTIWALMYHMGHRHIPVGIGSDGSDEDHMEREYEYDTEISAGTLGEAMIVNGKRLMEEKLNKCLAAHTKIKVLCISSLRDIAELCEEHPKMVVATVESFYIQGGVLSDGVLEPDESAANNKFDMESARKFYAFIEKYSMDCIVCTKHAAIASKLPVIEILAATDTAISRYLYRTVKAQQMAFYKQACSGEPYRPWMNKSWWIKNNTTWEELHGDCPAPEDESILKYIRIPVYDLIPAICCVSDEFSSSFGIHPKTVRTVDNGNRIRIVGYSASCTGVTPGVTSDRMQSLVIKALEYFT